MNYFTALCLSMVYISGFSQDKKATFYSDCIDAMQICELKSYHFSHVEGSGDFDNLIFSDSGFKETNSFWFALDPVVAGELAFTIIPDEEFDDLDFVLFESNSDCSGKNPIRVMASGENFLNDYSECLGQTGLDEISIDVLENYGCNNSDDNFLSPKHLDLNKKYYLLVNNFSSTDGFSIVFDNDSKLELKGNCKNASEDLSLTVFPNPCASYFDFTIGNGSVQGKIEIIDQIGNFISEQKVEDRITRVKTTAFPPGKYFVRYTNGIVIKIKSIIVTN